MKRQIMQLIMLFTAHIFPFFSSSLEKQMYKPKKTAVTLADPISGMMEYDREQFESVFESRGCQCAIISETQEVEV